MAHQPGRADRRPKGNGPERIRCGPRSLVVLERLSSLREVYRVMDPAGGRSIRRLTILPAGKDAEQHLRALRRVTENDPHHLPILELHHSAERILVLQPWIEGQSLEHYLDKARRGKAPIPGAVQAFRLARGLAHAMAKVHRVNDVVHGDLKPSNLLLVRGKNRLIPIDYGSAWPGGETLVRSPGDGVSPVYAAPEQLRGAGPVDWRADQFAIGVILFELLTLQVPYEGLGGRFGAIPGGETISLIPPSRQARDHDQLPKRLWSLLDGLVTQTLERDRDRRFASESEWLAELDRVDLHLRASADGNLRVAGIRDLLAYLFRWRGHSTG